MLRQLGLLAVLALAVPASAAFVARDAAGPEDVWLTFRSASGGYTIDYPADWTVEEHAAAPDVLVTTFTSPTGGAGVEVNVQPPGSESAGYTDVPNTRCQPVTVGGLPGLRCFDTLSFTTTTTLPSQDRTYTIATAGKLLDSDTYQRFLASFAVTGGPDGLEGSVSGSAPPPAPAGATGATGAGQTAGGVTAASDPAWPPVTDPCSGRSGAGKAQPLCPPP